MKDIVRFLNIDILSTTRDELLKNLKKGVLITPNVDHLVKLQKDKDFYDVYQKAEWVVCDSKILYMMSKLLKKPLPSVSISARRWPISPVYMEICVL